MTLFGADGKQVATYQPLLSGTTITFYMQAERSYFGGKLVGQLTSGAMQAAVQDRLGSVGKYYPYGEERNLPQLANDQVKFATYTRDSATGNDYADQRYYTSALGRFMSPDQGPAVLRSPQSWNRYTYAFNDPVNVNDPMGLLGNFYCIGYIDSLPAGDPEATLGCTTSTTIAEELGGLLVVYPNPDPTQLMARAIAKRLNAYVQQGLVNDWTFVGDGLNLDINVNWDGVFDLFAASPIPLPAPGASATFWEWVIAALRANPLTLALALFVVQTGSMPSPPGPDKCPDKDHFWNPDQAPHDGWTFKDGKWWSPDGRFTLRPNLQHDAPKGPHWELQRNGDPRKWECFPDGTMNAEGWNN